MLATFDVDCDGQVATAGFSGFGVGGPIQLGYTAPTDLTSAYAVLDPAAG